MFEWYMRIHLVKFKRHLLMVKDKELCIKMCALNLFNCVRQSLKDH